MALDPQGGFDQLMAMSRGFQAAQMLRVAVELAVFDFLEEPHSAGETAAWLKADDRATGIFLNGLAALGLLAKGVDYFKNHAIASRFLVQGKDNYRGSIIKHMGHTWERGWQDLKTTVLTGHPQEVEPERWRWLEGKPQEDESEVQAFIWGMHAIARDLAPKVAAKLDLTGARHLLDLGGGPATYAIAFVQANPHLRATVFDLPGPIKIAVENIAKSGLGARLDTMAGNFHQDDIGRGYDCIWVSQILHSHSVEQCHLLLAKAVNSLEPGGMLVIQDFFLADDGYTPVEAAMFGVHMLAVTSQGRAYTRGEVAEWMREAGLTDPEHLVTGLDTSILVARKK